MKEDELRHIALEITKEDLYSFYKEILKGKIKRSFTLGEELAKEIFARNDSVEVYYLQIGSLELELFVNGEEQDKSFNHICLELSNASDICKSACDNNYWTYARTSSNKETYFIKDSNENLFELKQLQKD